ncbi:YdcF family protein [Rhodococcus sp. JS3073]|uniref:YdcF family protein n=1 Tax=Rhodococcus sp. JS3073 TaxID=3002901 RepID=UPI0022863E5C|nr:YdcF family protein [Rhodococcus sp. JS3073]WAM16828.1 YdcF family protein [Rhodococcus sp. JS3073]
MRQLRITFSILVVGASLASFGLAAGGYFVYTDSEFDPVRPVDAIVVLGGEDDGRVQYGIELARHGVSQNVVLSDWFLGTSKKMAAYCATKDPGIVITCFPPTPPTTRGEAMFTSDLAAQHNWKSLLVISWRYHLPRARYIFSQCFKGEIVMRPVPRDYNFSLAEWGYTYLYQTVGFAKAFLEDPC